MKRTGIVIELSRQQISNLLKIYWEKKTSVWWDCVFLSMAYLRSFVGFSEVSVLLIDYLKEILLGLERSWEKTGKDEYCSGNKKWINISGSINSKTKNKNILPIINKRILIFTRIKERSGKCFLVLFMKLGTKLRCFNQQLKLYIVQFCSSAFKLKTRSEISLLEEKKRDYLT